MNKRWRWGLALLSILGIGVCILFLIPRGPTIHGQSLRGWYRNARSTDAKVSRAAWDAFNSASNTLPVCLALLELQPNALDKAYAAAWPKVVPKLPKWIAQKLPPPNLGYDSLRWIAVERLGRLGPAASNAVPALAALLNTVDSMTLDYVIQSLGRIGPAAAPAAPRLTKLIGENLGRIGLAAAPGAPRLAPLIVNPSVPANTPAAPSPVPFGFPNQAQFTGERAKKAIIALGQIGWNNAGVIEGLAMALTNRNADICLAAAESLWKLERQPQRLLTVVDGLLAELGLNPVHRRAAARILAQIAEAERSALRHLEPWLGDKDIHIRLIASKTLWQLDGRTNTYVRVLADWVKERNEGERWNAIAEIAKLAGQDELVLPAIIGALQDESYRVRGRAAITLGTLGPAASNAVPALTEALKDEYLNVRDAATEALKRIATKRTPESAK